MKCGPEYSFTVEMVLVEDGKYSEKDDIQLPDSMKMLSSVLAEESDVVLSSLHSMLYYAPFIMVLREHIRGVEICRRTK